MEKSMKDYSQKGEQQVIIDYFGDHIGTFLDIGANDGFTFSNSYALSELGWSGVCVEPNKGAYKALVELARKNVLCLNSCIGAENKDIIFYESTDSLVSTTVESEMHKWKKVQGFTPIKTKMITFAQMLDRSFIKTFDFITIDTEGVDYEILSQIDLTDTKMVCVEVNERGRNEYLEYCEKYALKLLLDNNLNLIFAR
jgi:FkbM family methyltransferase